jgi:hypothetical protein
VLAREFPELAERYARHFARREGVSPAYQRALTQRLRELRRLYGFSPDESWSRKRPPVAEGDDEPGGVGAEEQPLLL